MSRSPKSTNYSLSEEHVQRILRELETARKQAEERVAALRRQEKEQQKQVARDAAAAHQQQLGARIGDLDGQLAVHAASDVASAHFGQRLQRMTEALATCRRDTAGGQFDAVERQIQRLAGELQGLGAEIQARALQERQRGAFVEALVGVLQEQGFQARAELDPNAGYAGPVIVHAVDPLRRELITEVPLTGPVTYHGEGFPHREADGGQVATCDEQETVLERVHAMLMDRGVRTSEIEWEGKPRRVGAEAKAPPWQRATRTRGEPR